MYVFGGVGDPGVEWIRGFDLRLPILWKQGNFWMCVCVWVAVVWGVCMGLGNQRSSPY